MNLSFVGKRWVGEVLRHSYLKPLLSENPVFIDLGANKGEFAEKIISLHGGTVYAYEPVEELFDSIPISNQIIKFKEAIGNEDGFTRLSLSTGDCVSVLGYDKVDSITVPCVSLETAIARVGEIDLLKVDIEGAEVEMFEGLNPLVLGWCKQITVEFHDFIYPELEPRIEAIKEKIGEEGFYVMPFSLTNGDVLFVRKDLISYPFYIFLMYPVKFLRGIGRLIEKAKGASHP